MGELERLREQLREAHRLREEEQRRREAAEGRALKEQHQREKEQRRREEEQRRREEAEKLADESRPLTLQPYLETCHSLSLAIEVITDRSLTTQGDTTNPTGRIYPRRIIPWATFAREQEHVWDELSFSPSFSSQAAFPSRHQLDYVRSLLRPVSSEIGLRNSERDVVENAVQKLMDATYNDSSLRSHLGLDGTVTFESHTNLGITDDSLSESMEQVSIGSRPPSRLTRRRRKARGKGNRGDQFCIYRTLCFRPSDRRHPVKPGMTLLSISIHGPWRFIRSPIRTRSRCLPPQDGAQQPSGDDSDDNDDESPSPTPNPGVSRGGASTTTSTGVGSSEMQGHDGNAASQEGTNVRPNIQDRLYCTHECLRGLAFGGPMDQKCPNSADHGNAHINRREFLRLARDQLAVDRGKDADCVPLYLSGSRGSLFKFCLSSHGYTLVAKG
ncbi:hypothetical protein CDV36_015742, partial [Fusarium kuroshium]